MDVEMNAKAIKKTLDDTVALEKKVKEAQRTLKITEKDVRCKDTIIINRAKRKKRIAELANTCVRLILESTLLDISQIKYVLIGAAQEIKTAKKSAWENINTTLKRKSTSTDTEWLSATVNDLLKKMGSNKQKFLPSLGKYDTLEETVATDIINSPEGIKIWQYLKNNTEWTAVESNVAICKDIVSKGRLTEKILLKSLQDTINDCHKIYKENQDKFETLKNHVKIIKGILPESF